MRDCRSSLRKIELVPAAIAELVLLVPAASALVTLIPKDAPRSPWRQQRQATHPSSLPPAENTTSSQTARIFLTGNRVQTLASPPPKSPLQSTPLNIPHQSVPFVLDFCSLPSKVSIGPLVQSKLHSHCPPTHTHTRQHNLSTTTFSRCKSETVGE